MGEIEHSVAQDRFDPARFDRAGTAWLEEHLGKDTLLMQGPMGSELMGQVGSAQVPPAFWNVADPHEVERIHWMYRTVGADIMLTNTFQASGPALERDEVRAGMERVNRAAVACALHAGAPCTLGSMGPCGISWLADDTPEYRAVIAAYREQAYALLDAGCHGIVLETFIALRELEAALGAVQSVADGMPVLVSYAIDDEGNLLGDGLNIEAACMFAESHGARAVGVNCCSLEAATAAVPRMVRAVSVPVMVRPNAGDPQVDDEGQLHWYELPDDFAAACERWCADGALIVGGCCGTGPRTTCALSGCLEARARR